MTRTDFHRRQAAVRGALVDMTSQAGEAIVRATGALLRSDLAAAAAVAATHYRLDAARRAVEEQTYELLARQQPVARDLRSLVSGIRIGSEIDRMGSLAHHVAKVARLRHPACAVPAELTAVFEEMGSVARRMADGASAVLAAPDVADAARLEVDDDAMDALRRELFRLLFADWPHGVATAIDVALLGRYYERFADHAVSIADTIVYVVTGAAPGDRR